MRRHIVAFLFTVSRIHDARRLSIVSFIRVNTKCREWNALSNKLLRTTTEAADYSAASMVVRVCESGFTCIFEFVWSLDGCLEYLTCFNLQIAKLQSALSQVNTPLRFREELSNQIRICFTACVA